VETPLAGWLPLEVLDGVGHVDLCAVDPGLLERLVEHRARRPDERPSDEVLAIAGLLTDEHDRGPAATLPEHALGRARPEVTGATRVDRSGDPPQVVAR